MIEALTPEVFDALIGVNLVIGVFLAGRRFVRDIRSPLPDDAPDWARGVCDTAQAKSRPKDS